MNILCKIGWHKWKKYAISYVTKGEGESGRKCRRCNKYQWDTETKVRHYYRSHGDVPMTLSQSKRMKEQGYK